VIGTTGITFDANGTVAWTTAADGSAAGAGVGFVKVDDDTWVAAVEQGTGTLTQEVASMDSSATPYAWVIDTSAPNIAAATTQTSVSTFKIDASTTGGQLDGLISMVDDALEAMTSAAADLGSMSMRIDLQEEFVSSLTDSIDKGVGRLVDADMNEESTRLKALQTQQQLAIQSLSIANSSSEGILTLFR